MYLQDPAKGGGFGGAWCLSCKEPISESERATRVEFATDPRGMRGLTGDYHLACSKPFASMASALNTLSRFGR